MDINQEYANRKSKTAFKIVIILAAVLVLSAIITIVAMLLPTYIKIEAGESPDYDKILNTGDYEFDSSYNSDCINHPGKYKFTVNFKNRTKTIVLTVKDTKAPEVVLKKQICVSSTDIIQTADDFIETIYEADAYTGTILMDMSYAFQMGRSYEIEMRFSDPSGNKTEVLTSILSYVEDKSAPNIDVPETLYFEIGGAVTYRTCIKLTDNCIGNIKLAVDDSKVNYNKEGVYTITITATDVAGNVATKNAKVQILPSGTKTSIEDLNKRIAEICKTIITSDMTTEAKCRAVYDYVQSNIKYVSSSVGEGYVEIAYNALNTRSGDCASFFSVTKAFLDYLGIENREIRRTEGKGEGTHVWNYVNIGTADDPRWYHLDTTELAYNYNVSGCLLTTAQVKAYDEWREGVYFRHFNEMDYPRSETRIITPIPELEKYMK